MRKTQKPTNDVSVTKKARKIFRRYWLYDRLYRTTICGIFTVCLILVELFFTMGDGVVSNTGWMVYGVGLLICAVICCFWDSFKNWEISLMWDIDIYTDLQRYDNNFPYIGPLSCLTKGLLQTYFPIRTEPFVAWFCVIICILVGCHAYRIEGTVNIAALVLMWIIFFVCYLLIRMMVRKWLNPTNERLKYKIYREK